MKLIVVFVRRFHVDVCFCGYDFSPTRFHMSYTPFHIDDFPSTGCTYIP